MSNDYRWCRCGHVDDEHDEDEHYCQFHDNDGDGHYDRCSCDEFQLDKNYAPY